MGTSTTGFVTFHACPPHRVRRVFDLLEEYGFVDPDDRPSPLALDLDDKYGKEEQLEAGYAIRLADELVDGAPEVAFTAYEEPYEDQLGTTCTYVPGLGKFTTPCDNYGRALVSRDAVLTWMDLPAEQRAAKLGVPWETAIAAMPKGSVEESAQA